MKAGGGGGGGGGEAVRGLGKADQWRQAGESMGTHPHILTIRAIGGVSEGPENSVKIRAHLTLLAHSVSWSPQTPRTTSRLSGQMHGWK